MKLPGVPQAKQGREGAHQWAWTEAEVWNERMLANLERGITGGKWYSLMDKVWKMVNLKRAVQKVARGKSRKKADGRKCRRYAEESAQRLAGLQAQLQSGSYQPKPVQRVWIPKLGSKELRPIGIPEVENRVVEMAVRNVIEPIFEHSFAQHSYGFRPGRVYGCELICERGSGALARSGGAVASWSTKQRGLIRSKECGFCAPSKCVRINSEDFGLSVPALVRGGCTAMDTTCATAIRKALARNGSSATFAIRAG